MRPVAQPFDAVDAWIDSEGELELVTDPGAANRWKALGGVLFGIVV